MNDTRIYQRTDKGRQEIRNKSHGLTQSERLVLFTIDGRASCQALCEMLRSLSPERIGRALQKLEQLGLTTEILLPEPTAVEDLFEPEVVDLFLRQDELDPVTMICLDGDLIEHSIQPPVPAPAAAQEKINLEEWTAVPPSAVTISVPVAVEGAVDAVAKSPIAPTPVPTAPMPESASASLLGDWSWEFCSIGAGLAIIAASLAAHYIY